MMLVPGANNNKKREGFYIKKLTSKKQVHFTNAKTFTIFI